MNNNYNDDLFSQYMQNVGNNNVNFQDIAKKSYGDIEVSKYLYESGLQNVFDDYQKNVAILSQEKQKQMQDAYEIRELSKKYLGEVASNTGIGDVSGNLLDIYSNYQQNIGQINQNMSGLELNLEREYQTQRLDSLGKIMESQFGIEVGKLDDYTREIMFNIATGKTNNMNDFEYLESVREKIGEDAYKSLYQGLYEQQYQDIQDKLNNQYYGYRDTEDGRVRIETPEEFISQYENTLNPKDYQALSDNLAYNREIIDKLGSKSIMNKYNDSEKTIENENFVGDNYDFSLMTGENVNHLSYGFEETTSDGRKVRRFSVIEDATNDAKYEISSEDIFAEYQSKYEQGLTENPNPYNYDVITVNATNKETNNAEQVDYIFKNGTWHRLVNEKSVNELDMVFWNRDDDKSATSQKVKAKKNTITINDVKYETTTTKVNEETEKQVLNTFKEIYQKSAIKDYSYVMYNGKIYRYHNKNGQEIITEMKKQK